jgi:alpha-L-rhamnosidase
VTAAGRVGENTQTAYALALQFDLLPEDLRAEAARRLAEEVRTRGHLTTGFVGTPYLCHVLTRYGHLDVAYQLLNRKEYPSWLYPVTQGATTIWERWDGLKPDGSFQSEGMNSFNHYAYGAIGEWMYRVVAGLEIDPREPGYRHVLAQPRPGGGLTSADARLETLYGPTRSAWALVKNDRLQVSVLVPPNARGTVRLPKAVLADVSEGDQPVASAPGVRSATQGDGAVVVEVGSGEYHFTYPAGELAENLRSASYHVDETVAVLLANPEALAVIEAHLPGFSTHAMISTMRSLTLRRAMVLAEAPEGSLQKIDEELRQIPE